MDITKIPFNEFTGIKNSDDPRYLLSIPEADKYLNHVGTVHASAMFALAEAASGMFLQDEFGDREDLLPVVRKVETRYRKSASGKIYASAGFFRITKNDINDVLVSKGRALAGVEVNVYDTAGNMVMQSIFEWFISKR